MIIILEGVDRVGKTSVMKKICQLTNYKFPMMDRGPAGFMAYDIIFGRDTAERSASYAKNAEELNQMDVLIVYLYANGNELLNRMIKEGKELPYENHEDNINEIINRSDIYNTMIDIYSPGKVLKINTTTRPIDEVVRTILNEVDKRKRYWPIDMNNMIGTEIKTGIDVYSPSYNVIPEEVLLDMDEFDIDVDPVYYTMLFNQLDHAMYKYVKGLVNERNIFITSSDCISFVQIILTDPTRFVININQRSFNIEKHRHNDLTCFYYWFKNSELLNTYRERKLVINQMIGCPHSIKEECDNNEEDESEWE